MRVDSVRVWEWGRQNLVQSKRRRSWEGIEEGISHKLPPGAPSIPFRSESLLGSISPLGSKQSRCYCGVEGAHTHTHTHTHTYTQTGTRVARTLQKTTFMQKEALQWLYFVKHIICQLQLKYKQQKIIFHLVSGYKIWLRHLTCTVMSNGGEILVCYKVLTCIK